MTAPLTSDPADVLRALPVSVNGLVGDSLQSTQWADTIAKLDLLKRTRHTGPVMVPTKRCMTPAQIELLAQDYPDTWVFAAITGLNEERGRDLADYRESYLHACSRLKRVVCVIRPVIPGRNDNLSVIGPILDTVAEGSRMLVVGGYVDAKTPHSSRTVDPRLLTEVEGVCREHGILLAQRTACMVAAVDGGRCVIHGSGRPQNARLLRACGYRIDEVDDGLVMRVSSGDPPITRGDLNFTRMLAGCLPALKGRARQTELLSVMPGGITLACSSSWFTWARQVPCEVGCWYCFQDDVALRALMGSEVGCSPSSLVTGKGSVLPQHG